MKTFHLYDPETGAYRGTYDAQESPLEPGVYIAPNDSTEDAPPTRSGQVPKWKNGWKLVDAPPMTAESPEESKAAQIAALEAAAFNLADIRALLLVAVEKAAPQDLASIPAYQKLKAVDEAIKAVRK